MFGCELCLNKEYKLGGVKYAVFSFEGAVVEINGTCDVEYLSEDCATDHYLNLHLCLENQLNSTAGKKKANIKGSAMPRVLVLGVGRGTACRTLLNYSVRHSRCPFYVNLDVENVCTSLFVPCIFIQLKGARCISRNGLLCSFKRGH